MQAMVKKYYRCIPMYFTVYNEPNTCYDNSFLRPDVWTVVKNLLLRKYLHYSSVIELELNFHTVPTIIVTPPPWNHLLCY